MREMGERAERGRWETEWKAIREICDLEEKGKYEGDGRLHESQLKTDVTWESGKIRG